MGKATKATKAEALKRLQAGKITLEEFKSSPAAASPNYIDWKKFEEWLKAYYPDEHPRVIDEVLGVEGRLDELTDRSLNFLVLFSHLGPNFPQYLRDHIISDLSVV